MGGLHPGHGALIQRAAAHGPVLVSVFVNPLQFGPREDFQRYPRMLEADIALAQSWGAVAVWAPDSAVIYPEGQESAARLVAPADLQQHLCGAVRPGHFDGVVADVARREGLAAAGDPPPFGG